TTGAPNDQACTVIVTRAAVACVELHIRDGRVSVDHTESLLGTARMRRAEMSKYRRIVHRIDSYALGRGVGIRKPVICLELETVASVEIGSRREGEVAVGVH